jgi:putative OPT family oligopeptide transporter
MSEEKHRPFVPESVQMPEFTISAVVLGLVMTVVLGAANAYLGLRAGMTIAATYPAAVISMFILRLKRGSILEENLARTAGSIGESVAAGAVFTLPAFVIAHAWPSFDFKDAYWKSTCLMIVGSVLGVLFVSLVRRVMVEDRTLPFPESVAAGEIHKAGQRGAQAAKHLFWNMGFGALVYLLGAFQLFAAGKNFVVRLGQLATSTVRLGPTASANTLKTGAVTTFAAPAVSPAYIGVGYIIGPKVAGLNFAGGVLAWGLLVPTLLYFLGPTLAADQELKWLLGFTPVGQEVGWGGQAFAVWKFIVRPIAVGGMLVGAAATLFRMRKNLGAGLSRAFAELRTGAQTQESANRTERYMTSKTVFGLIGIVFAAMVVLYVYLANGVMAGVVAAVVMLIAGFLFATVSGYLVGMIGSSNNPISGLTLSTLIVAALLMVALGVSGASGVIAVLGVASVVCVSSAVAGELLQDFKVGYILGGTPRTIQIVELLAVVVASLVMYFPLMLLHQGNINAGGTGFGDPKLSAPQAGLMAMLSQGIVGGDMPWPLIVVGIVMGIGMLLLQVRSPMLVSVGMYLPLDTTFAIFVGGVIRWIVDGMMEKRGLNEAQKTRATNTGVLAASGLIAGEAMAGLVIAGFNFAKIDVPAIFADPSFIFGLVVMGLIAFTLIKLPLANAGSPDEPAPPAAMM